MTVISLMLMVLHSVHVLSQSSSSSPSSTMTSEPEGIETSSEGVVSPNYALRGFEGCLPDQVAAIKNGYSDMITMVNNDMYNYPKVDWNSGAAQDY